MDVRQKQVRWCSIATIVILLLGLSALGRRHLIERARSTGGLTAKLAIEKSTPLCRMLALPAETLRLSVDLSEIPGRRWWYVSCKDTHGKELATVIWDADSAELIEIGKSNYRSDPKGKRPLTRDEAIRFSRCWLMSLKGDTDVSHWQTLEASVGEGETWMILYSGEGRRCSLLIDRFSSDLIIARFLPGGNLRVSVSYAPCSTRAGS